MTAESIVKKALKEKKALLGSRSVIKAARSGKLDNLVYAKNLPSETLADIRHFENVTGIKPEEFNGNSMELGELCGKPFGVLLLGIRK